MEPIPYIDRATGKKEFEKVYGGKAVKFLYSHPLGTPLISLVCKFPLFSKLYGNLQHMRASQKKILPFIETYQVDASEFLDPIESFQSFNDFFIRKLKPSSRPIAAGKNVAIIPADGRYLFYQNIAETGGFVVKGQKFSLEKLIGNKSLSEKYQDGTLVIARLCPSDYHRFHFACDGIPGNSLLINGFLYSVNPFAVQQNVSIFTENKRKLCEIATDQFGKMLYIEVGATNVGTIHETYTPFQHYPKGAEKGYFSFGGSALILLFEKGALTLDSDLTQYPHTEIRCLMGQSLGKSTA